MDKRKTAEYVRMPTAEGTRYKFLCSVTGAGVCTRRPYEGATEEEALLIAWEKEGRSHFNRCQKCKKWVFDVAYNPEVLECIECAPFEAEAQFCKFCGVRVPEEARCCPACGRPLYYEGEDVHDQKA